MILAAVILIFIGALIHFGKMYNLIAGYNTMSKEEKAHYDIEEIGKLFFYVMVYMAAIIAIGAGLTYVYQNPKLEVYGLIVAVLTGIPYLLIQSNSKKYRKKQ